MFAEIREASKKPAAHAGLLHDSLGVEMLNNFVALTNDVDHDGLLATDQEARWRKLLLGERRH
jgi:hypothetical protein